MPGQPKSETATGEDALEAVKREIDEETGIKVSGKFIALTPIKQKSGKTVIAWAVEMDFDLSTLRSNTFSME